MAPSPRPRRFSSSSIAVARSCSQAWYFDHALERHDGLELLDDAAGVGLVEREAALAIEPDAAPPVVLGQDRRILPEDVGRRRRS